MIHKHLCVRFGLFATLGMTIAPSGWAQSGTSQNSWLEEIVVTAQRRSEKLQDVPISMSAITGATLENLGAKNFNDYAALIPNLSVGTGSGAGGNGNAFGVSSTRAVAIRGVAGNNTTALYLNDTPIPLSVDPRAIDIDRVEVLRGPQGTLFGAGSMGGTIRLVTRDPSAQQRNGKVNMEASLVNHGGGGYSADGFVNVPLVVDSVGLRVSGFSNYDPGVYSRIWGGQLDARSSVIPYPPGGVPTGRKDNIGAQQNTGFVVSLGITPNAIPGLSVMPLFMYQHSNSNGYSLADYEARNLNQFRPFDIPEEVEDTWTFAGVTAKQNTSFGQFIAFGTYFYRNAFDLEDTSDANAIVFWHIPYYVPAPLLNTLITRTLTGEARFESKLAGPVQFVVGVYDSLSERTYRQYYNAPGLNIATSLLGAATGTDLEYTQNSPNADRQRAAFLDVTYQVTHDLQLTAGVRRAYLDHEGTYVADGPLNGGSSAAYAEHGERNTAPRFTAKYQIAANQMIYASAAKGFRIGGTNSLLPDVLCGADLAKLGIINGQPFKSDSLWSYEIGSKNSWGDGHVRSRFAAYQIDWLGIQQSIYLPCTFSVVANSGAAQSRGAELEMDLAPIDHLMLNLSLGYENAKITKSTPQSATVVGQPLSDVPSWSGSLVAQYSIPMGERTGFIRGDYTYTGTRTSFNNVSPPVGRPLGSYSLANIRTGFSQGSWEFALFARNVFDSHGLVGDLLPEGAELPGRPRFFVVRPRTVGIQIRLDF